jgi:NAD(P)-dependent dehydrogenase (short-subunit alcohol dehydrogenase family)
MSWTTEDIPDLHGKTAVVTGGNVGLGFRSALELSRKGAHVVIGSRSVERGKEAIARMQQQGASAHVTAIALDLLDPASIDAFAEQVPFEQLDLLINNAGVVNLESHALDSRGHEMHMAVNHYGHFALTGRLLPRLLRAPAARIVTVSSGGHRAGKIDFDDLAWTKRPYSRTKAYGDSKLANLMFTAHLQTLLQEHGSKALSVASHPGLTGTERQQSIGIGGVLARWAASPVSRGVLPQLRAATDPSVEPCAFYGPRFGIRGAPAKVDFPEIDLDVARRLWAHTEEVTGVRFFEAETARQSAV